MALTAGRSELQATHPPQPFAVSVLVAVATVVALIAPVAGIAYAVLGAARTGVELSVPVKPAGSGWFMTADSASLITTSSSGMGDADNPVIVHPSGGTSAAIGFTQQVDYPIAILARSAGLVGGIAVGALVVLLLPVLRSTARGILFVPGSAARLVIGAACTTAAAALATLLPYLGAARLIHMPYGGAGGRWVADLQVVWWPLPIAGLLLLLAITVRAGTRLAEDTAGLV